VEKMKKKYISAILILLLTCGFCCAAVTPVNISDFTDTSWIIYGKTSIKASYIGSGAITGVGYVKFDSDGSTFSITDTEDYSIYGTYGIDPKTGGLLITVDEDNMQSFFDTYLGEILDDYDLDYSLDVVSAKSSCKVKYTGDLISLTITISGKAKFIIYYEDPDTGNEKQLKGSESFTITMTGEHPAAGGAANWASNWAIPAKASLSARKVKVSQMINLELTLGDFGTSGLAMNQYKLVDTNSLVLSSDIQSDFCRSKNKVYLWGQQSDIETTIHNLILNNNKGNIDSVDITAVYPKVTATVKDGKTIGLSGTIYFWADYYYNDGSNDAYDVKGSLKISGKGVPAP
jgi:hypothetical protein